MTPYYCLHLLYSLAPLLYFLPCYYGSLITDIYLYSYNITVQEDAAVGEDLLEIKAQSTDTGLNNVIKYRIIDGSSDGLFHIDPDSGGCHLALLKLD